jgi:predicted ester cyclase
MSEMVEQMVRAMYAKNYYDQWPGSLSYVEREVFYRSARAALEAMREPSEAMVSAAPDLRDVDFYPTDVWRAMIEAALEK